MPEQTDRLADIQARAANGIADAADVDCLLREVLALQSEIAAATGQLQRLDGELVRLRQENREYEKALGLNEEAA